MRENMGLYRGKRKDNGEWVFGSLYKQTEFYGDPCVEWYIITSTESLEYDQALEYHEVDPETVGEFTGMTDKNHKKIFEGDIVQTIKTEFKPPRKYKKPFQVHYNSDFPITVEEYYSPFEHFTEKVAYEVVGNTHDNPELLEVK